jgi:hypothetical protein
MATLPVSGYGMSVAVPDGWNAVIWTRAGDPDSETPTKAYPVLQLCTQPIPEFAGTYGSGVTDQLKSGDAFIAVAEVAASDKATIFTPIEKMFALEAGDFHPAILQRTIQGQAGCQYFFQLGARNFNFVAVLGDYQTEKAMIPAMNEILTSISLYDADPTVKLNA